MLVVDDDADLRESVCEMLNEEGFRTFDAINGLDALNHVMSGIRPDVILLDMMMPVMDGPAFLVGLNQTTFRDVPVVIMTAIQERAAKIVSAVRATSPDEIMCKPFKREQIVDVVNRMVVRGPKKP